MKQVVQNMRSGQMDLLDVPAPQVGKGELLVSTKASVISAGTEKMLIDFAAKSLLGKAQERPDLVQKVMEKAKRDGLVSTAKSVFSKLEQPLPLGYSAAGEVIAIGEGLESQYKIGDRVAIAGAGLANHAEINAVPVNLTAKIPSGVLYKHAAFTTLAAIAMQGVRNANISLGDRVLVMGLGLVGQLTSQLLKASGCKVFATDYSADRVKLAEECGVDMVHLMSAGNMNGLVNDFTNGKGFDAVVICAATDSHEPVNQAATFARDKATIVMTGKAGTEIPYSSYMKKELNFVVSRSYGPGRYDANFEQKGQEYPIGYIRWTEKANLEEALHLMSTGQLKIDPLISHQFDIQDANSAYETVLGDIPTLGVVLEYNRAYEDRLEPRQNLRPVEIVTGKVGVSFIGAGGFSQGVLMPLLQKNEDVNLTGVLSKNGLSAQTAGKRFGFRFSARDEAELWEDTQTNAVMITTRHNTHAEYVCQALSQNKHVFVEKPLAMTFDELDAVETMYKQSGRVLMVGFNRRYSPYTQALKDTFKTIGAVRQIIIRVNAGRLEEDNWQSDPAVGGGRLIGECCHFIDLAMTLAESRAEEIYAVAGKGQDVMTITIRHANGGLSTICYTSEGDTSYSKERVEMYAGGAVGIIDNFMGAEVIQNGKSKKFKVKGGFLSGSQDKGHANELAYFLAAVKGDITPPPAEKMFISTRLTLLAKESMLQGIPLKATL